MIAVLFHEPHTVYSRN